MTSAPWSVALLGSGEFEPWTAPVDHWLLQRASGDGTVLILPAASAPEGDAIFDRWANMGLQHFGALGIAAEVVPIKSREDAQRPEHVVRLDDASMVYFSGGNPAYLASVLSGSAFWEALVGAMDRGLGYAGCSAGVASLGEFALDSAARSFTPQELWRPGLRLFPKLWFGPHWDAIDRFVPGLKDLIISSVPADGRLLGIDERTAVVGDGAEWAVMGSGAVHLIGNGTAMDVIAGQAFSASLRPREVVPD
jgi:cyanophycinase